MSDVYREVEVSPDRVVKVSEYQQLENEVGAVVWDAGLVLANYLIKQAREGHVSFTGKRVLELGAGTGIAGLVTAALGATVTLTDKPHLVHHMQQNVEVGFAEHIGFRVSIN
eukprot:jgi/Chrzof1/3885/Cz13g12040.t1